MFFAEYTTPYELRTGSVCAEALLARYVEAKPDLLGDEGLGVSEPCLSIAVGDIVYEFLVDLSPTPHETSPDCLTWEKWEVVNGQLDNGSGGFFEGERVPLTWAGMVESLCQYFELSPDVVWNTGIDLRAYWAASGDDEAYPLPLEADAARFVLKTLYGPTPQ